MRYLVVLLSAFLITSTISYAQPEHYNPVRGELGLTGAFTTGGDLKAGGAGFYTEIKGNFDDQFSMGVRFEFDAMVGGSITDNSSSSDFDIGVVTVMSALIKSEYFLTTTYVRPFVGLGTGLYVLASTSSNSNGNASLSAGTHFGFMPQFGLNLGAFRMAFQYHIVLGKDQITYNTNETKEIGRSYIGIDIGFSLGGKRKERE